jgi:GNAT superfamily N-acetyltransferase
MDVEITEGDASCLVEYAAIPIMYRVSQRLVRSPSTSTVRESLRVEPVAQPYDKDYDAISGMSPSLWVSRYDLRQWGLLIARHDGRPIGAAAVAPSSAVMPEAEWARPTAVLWDLRVAPEQRRHQVGHSLFRAAEHWAFRHRQRALVAETQDVNVAAARFYEAMGCVLLSFQENAYDEAPGEARLLWYRTLGAPPIA